LPDQCDATRRDEARMMLAEIYNWFTEVSGAGEIRAR
jgi:hypothetical protein